MIEINEVILTANDIGAFLTVIGALVLTTNIITEVIKHTFSNFPAQVTATVVSMVLTICAFFCYAAIAGIEIEWYMIVGAVVAGFFVSYGAQFGFDKLKEIINQFKGAGK